MNSILQISVLLGVLLLCGAVKHKRESISEECGVDEHFNDCGSECADECGPGVRTCPPICDSGCFCNSGLSRHPDGRCVPHSECPCGDNEHHHYCGPACELTCENHNEPPMSCPPVCTEGCFCNSDFVRDSEGRCILTDQCPS